MPREACRLRLRVTAVRLERLQKIDGDGAKAEGFVAEKNNTALGNFVTLWNKINKKRGYGWDNNPHVFVCEFEREAEEDE